ncbi:uncharacterized protein LOC143040240 [Oratosquilla oratoria]|uniref:uncharacterized protein LOC143040240 n=1 Tax=Oratosquilla oratoria TaxID=337810 RepID=UPI003F769F30
MPGLRSLAVRRRSTRSPHGLPPSHPPHTHTSCQNKETTPHLTSFEHQERKDGTTLQEEHEDCDQDLQDWRNKSKGSVLQVLEPRVTPLTDVINPAPIASGLSDLTLESSDITKYKDCVQENSAKQRSPSCESGLDLSFDKSKEEEEASRGRIEGECSKSCGSGISGTEKVEVCCVDDDGFVCLGEKEDNTMASVMERTSATNRDSSSPCLQERIVIKMKLLPNSDMNKENNGKGLWLNGDCTTEGIVHKYTRWTIDSIINGEGHTRRGDASWPSRSSEVKTEPDAVETDVSMLNGYDCSVKETKQERNQCEWQDGIKKERLDYDENGYEETSNGGIGDDRRERDCYASSRFFPYEINTGRKRTKSSSSPFNSSGGQICKCTDRDRPDHKCNVHFGFSGSKSKNRSERENGKRVSSSIKKCSIIIKKVYTPNNESSYESSLCENSYDSPDEDHPAELEEASVVRPKRKAAVLASEKCHETLDSFGEVKDCKPDKLLNKDEGLTKHFKKEPVMLLKDIKKEPEPFEHVHDEIEGFWKPIGDEQHEDKKVLDKEPGEVLKEFEEQQQVRVVTRLSKELLGQMKHKDKEPVGLCKQMDKESLPVGLLKRMEKEPMGVLKGIGKESIGLLKQFDKEPVVLVRPVEKELAGLVKQISKESMGLIEQIKKEPINIKQIKKEPVVSPKPVKPRRTRLSTCSIRTRSRSSELDPAHPSTPVTPQVQIVNHSLPTQCDDKNSMFSPDSKQVLQCSVRLCDVFMNQFGRFICPSCDKPYNSNDCVCVNLGDLTMVFDCKKCFWVVKRRIATKEVQYLS